IPVCCFSTRTAAAGIYTLSLHDALPILPLGPDLEEAVGVEVVVDDVAVAQRALEPVHVVAVDGVVAEVLDRVALRLVVDEGAVRSEEHTSELQSRVDLVCRLLLEKKKTH